jgi:Mrp family chromosome partitioning ATPase
MSRQVQTWERIEAPGMAQIIRSDGNRESVEQVGRGGVDGPVNAADPLGSLPEVLALEESCEVTPGSVSPVVAATVISRSDVSEQFRILRFRVQRIGEQRPFRCIGMMSATPGEGKTISALGLAHALSQLPNCRVLLLEADVRRPSVERHLSIPKAAGLGEWLKGGSGPCPVRRVGGAGFWLLSAGEPCARGTELLGLERMAELLTAVRSFFDFTIVDCPPLVPIADAVILQDLLDGCLLVVRARHSPRETLLRAVSNLKPDLIQGVIFNDQREILSSRHRYGSRYSYGLDDER